MCTEDVVLTWKRRDATKEFYLGWIELHHQGERTLKRKLATETWHLDLLTAADRTKIETSPTRQNGPWTDRWTWVYNRTVPRDFFIKRTVLIVVQLAEREDRNGKRWSNGKSHWAGTRHRSTKRRKPTLESRIAKSKRSVEKIRRNALRSGQTER